MNHRDAILEAVRGTGTGPVPYAPRFDLWFNAHTFRGTMPEAYRDCRTPLDIARRMGVAGHAVIADFIRPEDPSQTIDRGLGLYNLPQFPFRVTLRDIERLVTRSDDETAVTYRTPRGTVDVRYRLTTDMQNAGASISVVTKHALISENDIDPLVHIFDRLDVEPSFGGLERMIDEAGDDALVVADVSLPGSPLQFIMRDLMEVVPFMYALADYPEKLAKLTEAIGGFFERIMPIGASCPCDLLLFGANMDETITYPPFYEMHILPWIARFSAMAHDYGKHVLIHADGENRALFDLYRQSGIDVLEAVATTPMTKSDIHDVLERSQDMTVWGGIPSIVLLRESFGEAAFEAFMRDILDAIEASPRFILGVSDTTPPDADFDRLLAIRDMIGG